MRCPFCGSSDSKVIDSRPTDEGVAIRRRRECVNCEKRFTTYETIESLPIIVIKKDKTREQFNREKLLAGITRACEKRPVETHKLDALVDKIELELQNTLIDCRHRSGKLLKTIYHNASLSFCFLLTHQHSHHITGMLICQHPCVKRKSPVHLCR